MTEPRTLAALLPPIARQALGQHGAALGALFADWSAAIGEAVARWAVPERLALAGPRQQTGVLTLRVDSADAVELQHDAPRRIARITGSRRRRPLTPSEQAALETALAGIDDDSLRARLAALGRALDRRDPAR